MDKSSSETDWEQRRAHFRLRYPEFERPRCVLGDETHEVTELSEGGMRLHLVEDDEPWLEREHIDGVLELQSGRQYIRGDFLRAADDEVVFQLTQGVDLRCMISEQKLLVRRYPALFGKSSDD